VKKQRTEYRLRNWSQYNRSLIARGSLTLWIEEGIQDKWRHEVKEGTTGKRGASPIYTDLAITTCRSLGLVLKLPLRQSIGLVQSLFERAGINLPVPDYSTLSRRSRTLEIDLGVARSDRPRHLVIDSTGLKVYGEGEWKVRQHGVGKRRTWRKLHLAVDADTGEILACQMTEGDAADGPLLPTLVEQSQEVGGTVETARADGLAQAGYDPQRIDGGGELDQDHLAEGRRLTDLVPRIPVHAGIQTGSRLSRGRAEGNKNDNAPESLGRVFLHRI
jgi:hypothetical protein